MAQRKRAGPITQRSVDRNYTLLTDFCKYLSNVLPLQLRLPVNTHVFRKKLSGASGLTFGNENSRRLTKMAALVRRFQMRATTSSAKLKIKANIVPITNQSAKLTIVNIQTARQCSSC